MATESFFSSASLAYLASAGAGKDGKAYSIKPTDGTGDFTFSRGSNLSATRIGSDGLIEKGRENLFAYSNDFSQWVIINTTETGGQTGYDGSSDAWLLTKTNANGRIYQSISSSGVRSISIYAKAGTLDWVRLQVIDAINNPNVFFDLQNGVIGVNAGANYVDSSIESIGTDGWYRLRITFDKAITLFNIYPAEGDEDTSGTSGSIYIQDAQLEIGLAATDYIESGASTGKAGLLEDEPRFDYSGGATCPSLLLEPSRTNLVKYSEYLGSTDWGAFPTSDPVTHTQNYAIAPDGTQTASLLGNFTSGGFNAVNNSNYRTSTLATQNPLDDTYTMSVWLKTTSGTGTISLLNRGLSSGANSPTSLQCNVTNEWKRFKLSNTYTAAEGASSLGFIIIKTNTDTLEEVLVWGAQMEQGSYPTSYIPNHSGGTITRGGESSTGGNDIYGGVSEGAFFFEFQKTIQGESQTAINLTNDGVQQIRLHFDSGVQARFRDALNSFANIGGLFDAYTSAVKVVLNINGSTAKVFLNGSQLGSDYTITTAHIFKDLVFSDKGFIVKQHLFFSTPLSDADCITLTT